MSDDPDKGPHAVPCGHIFCKGCIGAFEPPNCPNCRSPLDPDRAVKLHIDRITASNDADQSQQATSPRTLDDDELIFEAMQDQQLQIVFERETSQAIEAELTEKCNALEKKVADHEAELERLRTAQARWMAGNDQDYQLQIVFERETAQAIEAELFGKCKLLEEKVGELEADVDRWRRKMLRERAQKEQLARGIEDGQRQMAFEKETAQAVEAALHKKSKDLEEEVAEYEAVVERMRTELDLYKDRNRRSVLHQPSDERRRDSSFITLLAGTPVKTLGAAAASSFATRTPNRSTSTSPSNDDEEDDSSPGREEKKLNKIPSQSNSLAYYQQNIGSEPYFGTGSTQRYQANPQPSGTWTFQQTQPGFSQQSQQTSFLAQPQGTSQRQSHGGSLYLQHTSPHAGDQGYIPPFAMGSNTGTPSAYPGSPSPAGPSTFRLTPSPMPGSSVESPKSTGDQNGAYDFRIQQQQPLSSLQSQPTGAPNSSTLNYGASSPGPAVTWGAWPSFTSARKPTSSSDEQDPRSSATMTRSSPPVTPSPPGNSSHMRRMASLKAFKPLSDFGASLLASLPSISSSQSQSPVDQNDSSAHHHIASER